MSIWYSISAEFTLRPDADRAALDAAVAEYEKRTIPAVAITGDTVRVEAEGVMGYILIANLRADLIRLIHDFGNGEAVHITTHSSDDDDAGAWHSYAGRKAGVLAALDAELMQRLGELLTQYARQVDRLADKAPDAFVETEGW